MPVRTKKTLKKSKKRTIRKKTKRKLPTISLCMIVRDAAKNLALCLDSVKNVVDEIVIVDTGSKDNTVAIAKKYTDKVYFFKWCDDFAKARNYSLRYATKDWVLVLDDDEVLTLKSAKEIKKYLAKEPKDQNAYTVWIYECEREDAEKETWQKKIYKGWNVHQHSRLFRNHIGLKYKNRLHEVIIEKKSKVAYTSQLSLLHYGYLSEPDPDRLIRNFRIMEQYLQEKPDDMKCLFEYTRALNGVNGEGAKILEFMDKTITCYIRKKKHNRSLPLSYVYRTFIDILVRGKTYSVAEKYCYAWLTRLKDNYDLLPYLLLGKVLFLQDKVDDAYRILNMVYIRHNNGIEFCREQMLDMFKMDLYFFYGSACLIKGEYKKALKLLKIVKKDYFTNYNVDTLIETAKNGLAQV